MENIPEPPKFRIGDKVCYSDYIYTTIVSVEKEPYGAGIYNYRIDGYGHSISEDRLRFCTDFELGIFY